ncbi:MAG: tRNA (guanine-N7)-methyltransferase [Polyangiaceae bacterium]
MVGSSEHAREPKRGPYANAPALPAGDEPVDVSQIIPGAGPFELEIGPGRGGFVFERCAAAPEARVLGLEIRRKWASIVDARLAKAGLGGRARVLAADAGQALPRLRPDGALERAFLHFPDPWWKRRHHKRLVMQDALLTELARLLRRGGELFVQTDVEERAHEYAARISASPDFEPAGDEPGSPWLIENPYGARSPREHRAIADGLPVHRMRFRRR